MRISTTTAAARTASICTSDPSYSGLGSILSGEAGIAKLNAPNMAFVTRDAARLGPLEQENFHAVQSFAQGGLGNAWGAGLYRWVDADLRDFPISLADLEPYFDALTQEAGISGADDDLTPFFGSPGGLLPPLALSHNANRVYSAYRRRREGLRDRGLNFSALPARPCCRRRKTGVRPATTATSSSGSPSPTCTRPPSRSSG